MFSAETKSVSLNILLPERFCHASQVFILLLKPLKLSQNLGEFPAGPLRMFAVLHQVATDVEEESAPGQQHQGNPPPWACPGPHASTTPTKSVLWCARPPVDTPAGLPAFMCTQALCSVTRNATALILVLASLQGWQMVDEWEKCAYVAKDYLWKGKRCFSSDQPVFPVC